MKRLHVAVAIIINAANKVLVAKRPIGKLAAGRWEFPGGKVEVGESVQDALIRECYEELGVKVEPGSFITRLDYDYPDRSVSLDTWQVHVSSGQPHGAEGQRLAWMKLSDLRNYDLLEASVQLITHIERIK
jgi:8-oxo-dGTP diphosphatase